MDWAHLRFNDEPLDLYIPPCIWSPPREQHLPPLHKPLRICIEGPLVAIKKLLPDSQWEFKTHFTKFPQAGGRDLAQLAYKYIYKQQPIEANDLVIRDEYLGVIADPCHLMQFDYYGVTFDHLVPADDTDPEVLQINILETDHDDGEYANSGLRFHIDAEDYRGKKVLAVPRCCQKRRGTTDRLRINDGVHMRQKWLEEEKEYLALTQQATEQSTSSEKPVP